MNLWSNFYFKYYEKNIIWLAAKAGYNEPNEVYYCLDQNNNPKIECVIPDEPGIQNSDFEDLYTVPYTYELIDWLRNTHKIYISIFPVTWFQLSVNIYKIEENQVKEVLLWCRL